MRAVAHPTTLFPPRPSGSIHQTLQSAHARLTRPPDVQTSPIPFCSYPRLTAACLPPSQPKPNSYLLSTDYEASSLLPTYIPTEVPINSSLASPPPLAYFAPSHPKRCNPNAESPNRSRKGGAPRASSRSPQGKKGSAKPSLRSPENTHPAAFKSDSKPSPSRRKKPSRHSPLTITFKQKQIRGCFVGEPCLLRLFARQSSHDRQPGELRARQEAPNVKTAPTGRPSSS